MKSRKNESIMLVAGLAFGLVMQLPTPVAFAQAQAKPAVELEAAIAKEQVDGDLKTAIAAYQKIAANTSATRDVRSKALLHLAGCYEKLGQRTETVYQQIVRDFADQPAAKQASAKLAAMQQGDRAPAATMTQRQIELQESGTGPVELDVTDGQRLVFKDSATGALTMSDLTGGGRRVIFKPNQRVINSFLLSRDSSLVVMVLAKPGSTKTFAVIRTDGTGFREIGGDWVGARPCDEEISWDDHYVLACQRQASGPPQLVRFTVSSGEVSRIRQVDGSSYRFSPDGRFIAYNSGKKILIIPSQGGEPQVAADSGPFFYDWTRDGLYLITDTTKDGARALNLLPVKDGRQVGQPVFVRYGNFEMGRSTANGGFIYAAIPQEGQVTPWLGNLDPAGGSPGWEKLSLGSSGAVTYHPAWSPDSTKIAYTTYNGAAGQYVADVRVHTLATGEDRDLYRSDLFTGCLWSAHRPSLFCMQRGTGNTAALSISTETGATETLGNIPPDIDAAVVPVLLTADGKGVYLASQKQGLVRWEIGATQWTTVLPNPNGAQSMGYASVSPDMRWVTRWANGNVEIRPMPDGDWRPLVPAPNRMFPAFTPDGNWFLYRGVDAAGKDGLFRVATSGGQPERLGDFPGKTVAGGYVWVSPNGKNVIAEGFNHEELWMLENFEPKPQAAK